MKKSIMAQIPFVSLYFCSKGQIGCTRHPGVIDCVLNTVLEAIQEEFGLPMKIHALPIRKAQSFSSRMEWADMQPAKLPARLQHQP